jgi:DNA-binding PadR family transcriptional regulator
MPIRHGLLALVERGPTHGYQLRAAFEDPTGGAWPLNVGQVHTTLARHERDGLVEPEAGSGDDDSRVVSRITDAGRAALAAWFASPLERTGRPRDELAIKLAIALTTLGVDVQRVVQQQRAATLRTLRDLTRMKAQADEHADAAWLLVHARGRAGTARRQTRQPARRGARSVHRLRRAHQHRAARLRRAVGRLGATVLGVPLLAALVAALCVRGNVSLVRRIDA